MTITLEQQLADRREQAIARGRRQSSRGPKFGEGECLKQVRTLLGIDSHDYTPGNGHAPWAIEAFAFAKDKHSGTTTKGLPRGVPFFFRNPRGGPGHIVLTTFDRHCLSTDILRTGFFDEVRIDLIPERWGLIPVGWAGDLNLVKVWTPPPPAARVTHNHVTVGRQLFEHGFQSIDAGVAELRKAPRSRSGVHRLADAEEALVEQGRHRMNLKTTPRS